MTRQITVGGVKIGGGAPVSIQSMLNTATSDVEGSLAQIAALKAAGCEIVRLAVPDLAAARCGCGSRITCVKPVRHWVCPLNVTLLSC